jgi:NADH-quinone oxidoreductase subunit M
MSFFASYANYSSFGGLLSVLIWLPIIAGVVIMIIGRDSNPMFSKMFALVFALITFIICLPLWLNFNPNMSQPYGDDLMQFVEMHHWIPFFNINYNLGVDGISVLFIILSCYTLLVVVLAAMRSVDYKLHQYMAIFLISTGIMNGCFAATDSILFYFFFEASLVPMYLGIGIWGGKNKYYAAIKFFLYTFLGSIFMLIAFLYMGSKTGDFQISSFIHMKLTQTEQNWIFAAFMASFAVKIPMWPVHTWLPDAHTEAPTGGSVVLAALMLKLGAYGFIRFLLPIVPGISKNLDIVFIVISLIGIVYVGLATMAQNNMKRLIAYSSISHMGIVTVGIFTTFMIIGQPQGHDYLHYDDAVLGIQGVVFQMIAHAFTSGALFIAADYIFRRFGTREIDNLGGIAKVMPVYAAFFVLFAMSNVGLPGTSGFVGEFMVILAVFKAHMWIGLVAGLTLIIAPAYTLWAVKRVIFSVPKGAVDKAIKEGVVNTKTGVIGKLKDLDYLEVIIFIILAVPVIYFGVYPDPIISTSHEASQAYVQHIITRVSTGVY